MHLARDVSHGAKPQGQRARHGRCGVGSGNAFEDRRGRRGDHQAGGHSLLRHYDAKPSGVAAYKAHGIDLAISQKESADYTTIVTGELFYVDGAPKIYIRPNPYNEHVLFHNFLKKVRSIPGELGGANLFFVEDVAYQKAAIQEMERALLPVTPMRPILDKRSRLQTVAPLIKNGTVLFPRAGCEELLGQMFNLGVESHDDLCDGLTTLLQGLSDQGLELPKIHWIEA